MKLLWAQDIDPLVHGGGAQLTDRSMILQGFRRGHDIELVTPQTPMALGDPMVISNASGFALSLFQEMQQKGIPYVFFAHDYWPLCRYRLYYPLAENCYTCYLKPRWLPILQAAKLIVWLSPLHREAWLQLYPELSQHPYALTPSPVDSRLFRDLKQTRSGVVAVHSLQEFKGRANVLQWALDHPDVRLTIVDTPEGGLPDNITVVGDVPYGRMNELYNRHEAFLHLPDAPEPFGRVTAEAMFAGCRIISNELSGALSWPFFCEGREAVASALADSPRVFWEAVEQALA